MAESVRNGRQGAGVTPRVVFAGSPAFAATILRRLHQAGWEIPLVITQPPAPQGRGQAVAPSAVAQTAEELKLTVASPQRIADVASQITDARADLMLVAAYGQIIPEAVFSIPRLGTLNLHGSILPKYRGATPIPAAIKAGESETGVSLMQIEAGLDTGPVFATATLPIEPTDTTGSLTERLAVLGATLAIAEIPRVLTGDLTATPQDDSSATVTKPLQKTDGRIDWNHPAKHIDRHVRAMQPWPGAWTETSEGTRIEILTATPVAEQAGPVGTVDPEGLVGTSKGSLRLERVKPAGRNEMAAADWLRGLRQPPQFT